MPKKQPKENEIEEPVVEASEDVEAVAAETEAEPAAEIVVPETNAGDMPELVPDGPFHGKWNLLTSVDFVDEDGKEVHIDAGVIEGSALPLAFAESLFEAGKLTKA